MRDELMANLREAIAGWLAVAPRHRERMERGHGVNQVTGRDFVRLIQRKDWTLARTRCLPGFSHAANNGSGAVAAVAMSGLLPGGAAEAVLDVVVHHKIQLLRR
jgi:hypothetical protein